MTPRRRTRCGMEYRLWRKLGHFRDRELKGPTTSELVVPGQSAGSELRRG